MQTFFTALNFRHPTEAGGGQSMGLASGGGDTGDGRVFLSPQVRLCSEPPLQVPLFTRLPLVLFLTSNHRDTLRPQFRHCCLEHLIQSTNQISFVES